MIDFETYVILLPPDAILGSKCTQNAFAAEALPRTPSIVVYCLLCVIELDLLRQLKSTLMTP